MVDGYSGFFHRDGGVRPAGIAEGLEFFGEGVLHDQELFEVVPEGRAPVVRGGPPGGRGGGLVENPTSPPRFFLLHETTSGFPMARAPVQHPGAECCRGDPHRDPTRRLFLPPPSRP